MAAYAVAEQGQFAEESPGAEQDRGIGPNDFHLPGRK